jgi:predicted dehydrogenase
MGGFHARVLRDLGLDVSTVDPDPAAGADYARVPHREFDVVCVAAPIGDLAEQAAGWAGHTGWLMVEKPFAATLHEAETLAMLLDDQACAVGYVERFNPQVRLLRVLLADCAPRLVRFRRWNDRQCADVALDLQSHDVDLAAFLGLECPVVFDARAGVLRRRLRVVEVVDVDCELAVDLMAHDCSPLHAQWHAFLAGQLGFAVPRDAVRVHEALARIPAAVAA